MGIKLFGFYILAFTLIGLIKTISYLRRRRIAINTIWFSRDGSVPPDAMSNLEKLAQDIRQSPYRRHYQLFFWTDLQTLNPKIRKTFQKQGIQVKDYRDVKSPVAWVEQLIALGDENNKLFFVLASDIFRFYLLLKEFPSKRTYANACYIDCNDITINHIPNPEIFTSLSLIAFHLVEFNFKQHTIFEKLLDGVDDERLLLTNDVIVTANRDNTVIFDKLFRSYCDNLQVIDFMAKLRWSRETMTVLDDDLVRVIIFTTTHMVNILYAEIERENKVFLLQFTEQGLKKSVVQKINDVRQYIDFERDYTKGFTCLQRENAETSLTENGDDCREFWYALFIRRYRLINHEQVIMNAIWFSPDGQMPEAVLQNCIQQATAMFKSPHGHCYRYYLWTNGKSFHPSIMQQLRQHHITVKNAYSLLPQDTAGKAVMEWVFQFIVLGQQNHTIFYVMASDLLRMYLLLKELPNSDPDAICCYIDCNDIKLNSIPDPKQLKKVSTIAFSRVSHVTTDVSKLYETLNNDVIIAVNENNKQTFAEIFSAYFHNFLYTDMLAQGIIPSLSTMKNLHEVLDKKTRVFLVTTTTHVLHTLSPGFLFTFSEQGLNKQVIPPIQDASTYFDCGIERHQNSWLQGSAEMIDENQWRELWSNIYNKKASLLGHPSLYWNLVIARSAFCDEATQALT